MRQNAFRLMVPAITLMALFAVPPAMAVPTSVTNEAVDMAPADNPQPLRFAQMDVDVFIDARGRRVYVDPYTGEILAIERPEYRERQRPRRAWIDPPNYEEPFYREDDGARIGGFRRVPQDRSRDVFPEAPPPAVRRQSREPEPRYQVRREPAPRLDRRSTGSVPLRPDVEEVAPVRANRQLTAKAQVLLDRAGASPGVIDGVMGSNMRNALDAWETITGKPLDMSDEATVDAALGAWGGPAFVSYEITNADAAGPFVASIPSDYGQKAQLERMSYTSAAEAIAEKFHMDEAYLKALNPNVNFGRPGTVIQVASPGMRVLKPVARIEADKGREQVRAYDEDGRLVAAYPATIGSEETPSPSGTVQIERIAFNPNYTYNPKKNFKQGNNDRILTIHPGPNGPVGSIWIALSKPSYGIHGTPEPSRIGKTNSHGCIRLTNWDATELARLVKPGVEVKFVE